MMREGQEKKVDPTKTTVLFCNPNGVFIQFFGFDNHTIRNYLKEVYFILFRVITL
jgi:hypothetical protein